MTLATPSYLSQSRRMILPAWISALIIVGSIPAGFWMLRSYVRRNAAPGDIKVTDRSPDDGVRRLQGDRWKISCGPAAIMVNRRAVRWNASNTADAPLDFQFYFERYEFLTPEQVQTLTQVRRLSLNPTLEKELGLEADVIRQLNELRGRAALTMDPTDTQRLRDLFGGYAKIEAAAHDAGTRSERAAIAIKNASSDTAKAAAQAEAARADSEFARLEAERSSAELSLVHFTAHVADRLFEPTRRSATERAAIARSLLTPAQWKRLRSLPTR